MVGCFTDDFSQGLILDQKNMVNTLLQLIHTIISGWKSITDGSYINGSITEIKADPRTIANASRRYKRLRLMFWSCTFGCFIIAVTVMLSASTLERVLSPLNIQILKTAVGILFCLCVLGSLIAKNRLLRFRCPRCSATSNLFFTIYSAENECKKCGLKLGK